MVKRAAGTIDGMALNRYLKGQVYDVSAALADYLVLQGFARPEMRTSNRVKLKRKIDRRYH